MIDNSKSPLRGNFRDTLMGLIAAIPLNEAGEHHFPFLGNAEREEMSLVLYVTGAHSSWAPNVINSR
jgi:hypothetical protein